MSVELDLAPAARLCDKHVADKHQSSLVMLLQEIQQHYGYLPREVLTAAASRLEVPLADLYGLATFYRSFSLTPRGKHEICVCTGTACHVRGAPLILAHLERALGVESGETTPDGFATLIGVNCLGACALGPVVVVDGKYHGKMTVAKTQEVIAALRDAG